MRQNIELFTKSNLGQQHNSTIENRECFYNKIVTRGAIRLSTWTIKNSQTLKNYSNRYNRYNLIQ